MSTELRDFFVAGGTLRAHAPSYVTRPADEELLRSLLAGEFCCILTARQMGKSSLMVRTATRLREQQISTVIIDLTSIGSVAMEAWYLGLLSRLRSGLRLEVDVQAWWQAQSLSAAQRFTTFLRTCVLDQVSEPIVVFIDEIDSTLSLPFRDDFFAAVRALYNARATDLAYDRLTFAFLGVATPTELIQDRERTPFNVGQRIDLQEFTYTDAQPLAAGLDSSFPGQGDSILRRIFHWTNGHPYLTQKLCLAVTSAVAHTQWDEAALDGVVAQTFFSDEGRKDTNLTFIQDRILGSPAPERRALLHLYRRVYQGKTIEDNDRSPVQNRLELYGLLKVKDNVLHVRNEIYRRVFNADWVSTNLPANPQLRIAIFAVLVMLLIVGGIAVYLTMQPDQDCETFVKQFRETSNSEVQLSALANLFNQTNGRCDQPALQLFYGMENADHEKLFLQLSNPANDVNNIRAVVDKVYRTLDWDQSDGRHDQRIMEAMLDVLQKAGVGKDDQLVQALTQWMEGRKEQRAGNLSGALSKYTVAIERAPEHPVLRYDRAMIYIELGNYRGALEDLDEVVRIAKLVPPTPTPIPSDTPTDTKTPTSLAISLTTTKTQTSTQPLRLTSTLTLSESTRISLPTENTSEGGEKAQFHSRFIDPTEIIKTIEDTIRRNPLLASNLQENKIAYAHLSEVNLPEIMTPSIETMTPSIPNSEFEARPPFFQIMKIETFNFPKISIYLYGENLPDDLSTFPVSVEEDETPVTLSDDITIEGASGTQTALVFDASGSVLMRGQSGEPIYVEVSKAARRIAGSSVFSSDRDYLTSIAYGTNRQPTVLHEWSQDHQAVVDSLYQYKPISNIGTTSINRLLEFTIAYMSEQPLPAGQLQSIVLFSDGIAILDATDRLRDTAQVASSKSIRIHTVLIGRSSQPKANDTLREIAYLTGGWSVSLSSVDALDSLWQLIAQGGRRRILTYLSTKERRNVVSVSLTLPDNKVITRSSDQFILPSVQPAKIAIISPVSGSVIEKIAPQFDTPIEQIAPRVIEIQATYEFFKENVPNIHSIEYVIAGKSEIVTNNFDQPFLFDISSLDTGEYSVSARVIDKLGNEFVSEPVFFEILVSRPIKPPTSTLASEIPLTPVAVRSPTSTPVPEILTESLITPLSPSENIIVRQGAINFSWKPNFALIKGQAFEVVIWRDGEDPMSDGIGSGGLTTQTTMTINLLEQGAVPATYHWGILLVQQEPYRRLQYLGGDWKLTLVQ